MTFENKITQQIVDSIEISETDYEKAQKRYRDIGDWLGREESSLAKHNPHIFPQGSFRIGTVVKPINEDEAYDLDLVCNLQNGITKKYITQKYLKDSVGKELDQYRKFRGIEEDLGEKQVCWSLLYKDQIGFYIDIVPSIPEEKEAKGSIKESMLIRGYSKHLSENVAELAVAITNNESEDYNLITDYWEISNPDGYAKWFENRMKTSTQFLRDRITEKKVASIDRLPIYKWKTPLQRAVQILKRHRDVMFENSDKYKPPSLIITTLAAHAYSGEENLFNAISNILMRMDRYINSDMPRIPNPVNNSEDLAKCWSLEDGEGEKYEQYFLMWLKEARRSYQYVTNEKKGNLIKEEVSKKFGATISSGFISDYNINPQPQSHNIVEPAKPWMKK